MPEHHSTPTNDSHRSSGRRSATPIVRLGVVAVSFTLVGMLIATQMDFTAPSVASPPLSNVTGALAPVGSNGGASPFVPVIERVSGAVVSVSGDRYEQNWFGGGTRKSKSSGTGFFFRPDGYVLTNNHVVDGTEDIEVTTAAGFRYEARLVGLDPATDLAVLKVDTDDHIAHIPFGDSDSIKVGEWAIAIGNPFPQQGLFGSVTVGVISALGRAGLNFGGESPDYQNYIQVDASINPGNSGGPLLNINGEAIGVNSAISSPTGASVGIGFAVPINIARAIIPDLIAYGEVKRGWLGVSMGMVTPADARRLQLDQVKGVVVERVIGNSPAESAGLRVDDIIYEYNGHEVSNPSQFSIL
ncbi:MAG TPA: trypsin-like peptidase domain-containing protein, partial [candidate division Zixibacteria bacterium]|nr:trypsin-like peptidase domain-containing protein [candidate division Zixibacteria bacterium]